MKLLFGVIVLLVVMVLPVEAAYDKHDYYGWRGSDVTPTTRTFRTRKATYKRAVRNYRYSYRKSYYHNRSGIRKHVMRRGRVVSVPRLPRSRPNTSLASVTPVLAAKVREINAACGSRVISAYRPGARVRGNGRLSLHAHYPSRAVDLQGNPKCIYARLRRWPGGVSTDYGRVRHVHISYAPNSSEWKMRFAHYSKTRRFRRAYASAG